MKHLLCIASLLAGLSTAAHAQSSCPTAADLPDGIEVRNTFGASEGFYPHAPGVIRSEYRDGDGQGTQTLLGQGIYWLQNVAVENYESVASTRITYSYPLDPQDMPVPTPAGAWNTPVVSTETNGKITQETQSAVFGEMTRLTIGACGYDMIPVTLEFGPDPYQEVIHYLPDLGLGLLALSKYDTEEPATFVYVAIEKVFGQ